MRIPLDNPRAEGTSKLREGEIRLRGDIWRAVTDFQKRLPWKFDLQNLRVLNPEVDAEAVAAEPERYIDLPSTGSEFQRGLARTFANEHARDVVPTIESMLAKHRWLSRISDTFEQKGLREQWARYRTTAIVDCIKAWAERHGIPLEKLIDAHDQRSIEAKPPRGSRRVVSGDVEKELRSLIHHAVDLMTVQELNALPIPAGYLVLALRRMAGGGRGIDT